MDDLNPQIATAPLGETGGRAFCTRWSTWTTGRTSLYWGKKLLDTVILSQRPHFRDQNTNARPPPF